MDKGELLATFTDRIHQYEKYQAFISKAREQAGKFASAVVDKVVRDNTQKCADIVGEIGPLTSELESMIDELRQSREQALDSAKESQFHLEELELRLAIGDLTDSDFRAEAADYKAVVASTDARVAELDQERMRLAEALEKWGRIGAANGVGGGSGYVTESPRSSGGGGRSVSVDSGSNSGDYGSPRAEPARSRGRSSPPPPMHQEVLEAQDEMDDVGEPIDAGPAEDELVFEDHNHVGSGNDGFEVDGIDLLGDEEDDLPVDDAGGEKEDKPRRAVLLYQEGTAEEQIYPFTGEVMSLGRGRDNDVQVKNDSKVSRYHCKLYRRGPNFYIEDNKSANGTLVNGELITERRLFGGEEVIIGETFFRFRILD
jgi:hypothetical protein